MCRTNQILTIHLQGIGQEFPMNEISSGIPPEGSSGFHFLISGYFQGSSPWKIHENSWRNPKNKEWIPEETSEGIPEEITFEIPGRKNHWSNFWSILQKIGVIPEGNLESIHKGTPVEILIRASGVIQEIPWGISEKKLIENQRRNF